MDRDKPLTPHIIDGTARNKGRAIGIVGGIAGPQLTTQRKPQ
jgi:hypothetical protein